MLCSRPYFKGIEALPCGRCLSCRINQRRVWTTRLLLEAASHPASCFVTLTYADEYLPAGGNLVPRDLMLWLKRLRKAVDPRKIRFFACGEYGDETLRPHYHAIIFGLNPWEAQLILPKTWLYGRTHAGFATRQSMQYVGGYVTKKATKDVVRIAELGLVPEFSRMSRNPAIGSKAVDAIASSLADAQGAAYVGRSGDVPKSVMIERKLLPIGRTLIRKLRDQMGYDPNEPEAKREERLAPLRAMREAAGSDSAYKVGLPMVEWQAILNKETKANIRRPRKV